MQLKLLLQLLRKPRLQVSPKLLMRTGAVVPGQPLAIEFTVTAIADGEKMG